jgi:hypothetical protein
MVRANNPNRALDGIELIRLRVDANRVRESRFIE